MMSKNEMIIFFFMSNPKQPDSTMIEYKSDQRVRLWVNIFKKISKKNI